MFLRVCWQRCVLAVLSLFLNFVFCSANEGPRVAFYGDGTTACAWFEYELSTLLVLTAVVT